MKQMLEIVDVLGREILDSRGNPTIEVEVVLEDDGKTPYTAHTTNLVPFYIVGANVKLRDGKLCDIAPTMLDLMGLKQPAEMTGETLIEA